MSQYSMHHNETLFPNSHEFVTERFLNDPKAPSLACHDGTRTSGAKKLSRYMTSFGKGTRECGCMPMSYAEIYLMMASIIRRCDLQAFETNYEDVGFIRDFAIPVPAADSKGMRVLVLKVE
jgi:cytochrome P450